MRHELLHLLVAVTTLLLASGAIAGQDFVTLQLLMATEKPSYFVGEPISMTVRLSNPSTVAVLAHDGLDPDFMRLRVYVRPEGGGDYQRYRGPQWGIRERHPVELEVAPGESLYASFSILFNRISLGDKEGFKKEVLLIPGRYEVRAELHDVGEEPRMIDSNVVTLTIEPPSAPDAQLTQTIQTDSEYAYFLQTGDARGGPLIVQSLEALLAQTPSSVGSTYVAWALGRHFERRRDLERSKYFYGLAATAGTGRYIRGLALLGLARIYAAGGEDEQAEALTRQAAHEYDKTGLQSEFTNLSRRLAESIRADQRRP